MTDARYISLARVLARHSTKLEPGDKVLIELHDVPDTMAVALIRAVREAGGVPLMQLQHGAVRRELLREGSAAQFDLQASLELARIQQMQAFIAIRGSNNINELADVPSENLLLEARAMRPMQDYRINQTRWVVLRWPSSSMAQLAGMSTEAFEDFYFAVCTLDYGRMTPGMEALRQRMESTDQVHITGPGTDLRFSIKGIPAIPCGGDRNIPDGEVFTCPVLDSVEGFVSYNAPSIYLGASFDNIRLEFQKGKIVNATSNNTSKLNAILDSDPGARYIGEFALGFNPLIREPMRDILFDEKIAGSFHFTPGQAYEKADNGNRSQVHWDMVCIQRPEWGGGEIRFDGELIRKDGLFVPDYLHLLNPEELLATA